MSRRASSAGGNGPSSSGGGGVSSAVRSGPSRSATVKALNAAGVTDDGANRYKYQGFNARIQNISIHFRNLLEPHEIAADEQAAEDRLSAANMFTSANAAAAASSASNVAASAVYVPGASFSSADLSSQDASGAHSYFSASLASLGSVQLHREFLGFLSEVRPLVGSFPLLLKNQKRIVGILLAHAAQPDNPAQAEIFTALTTLARDLRGEFTPYLGSVIETLLNVLDPSSPASVESVFQSLAFLIKHQAKYIAAAAAPSTSASGAQAQGSGFSRFFEETFSALLGHPKNYIRHFASETLAYLVRTIDRNNFGALAAAAAPAAGAAGAIGANKDRAAASPLLSLLRYTPSRASDEAFKDGLASALFECVKNIRFAFQTSHAKHVRAMLGLLHTARFLKSKAGASSKPVQEQDAALMSLREKESEYQFELQMRLHRRMANYTRRDQSAQVWEVLLDTLEKRHAATLQAMADPAQAAQFRLLAIECSRLLQLVALWSSHRSGSRLPSHDLMRKVLAMAFGTLFQRQPAAAAAAAAAARVGSGVEVEWKAQALSMLGKYWANFPQLFTTNILPSLRSAFAHLHVTSGAGAAAVVDEVGVENGALLLSFLESIRELQPNCMEHLAPGVTAAAQGLLLSPARTPQLAQVARSLGLGLLLELNALHPVGSSYRIQALDEFHRVSAALTPQQQRQRKRQQALREAQANGGDDDQTREEAEDEQMLDDADAADDDADPDVEEEEVDPSSYLTPLPQPSLYACSAYMFKLLSLSPAMQGFLVSQIAEAIGEQTFGAEALTAAAASAEGAASGSTLLLSATTTAARIANLWAVLQLLSTSGLDVSAPLSGLAAPLAAKHQKQLAAAMADPSVSAPAAAAPMSVASLLLAFSSELSKAIALQSQAAASTFIASTPLDSASAVTASGSSGEDDAHAETNNHLLVGHSLLDQLYFLRAQTMISLAALMKQRWSRSLVGDLQPAFAASAPRTALLPVLKSLTTQALSALSANPEHIAVVTAVDRVLEAAKSIQVGGVVDSELEGAATAAATEPAVTGGSSKKKKLASAHVPSASASSIARALDSVAELDRFLKALFSASSFSRQSLLLLPCLGSAHAFLRATSLSVLRYYTALRFISPEEEAAASAKKKASASAAAAAATASTDDAAAEMDIDDADAETSDAVTHTSELVGDCPVPSILHDLCLLSPTLEHEKEYVRLLKKLEVLVQSCRVPEAYLRVVPSVLLGLLHLKLNPLWSHVQKVLSSAVVMRYAVTPEKQRWIWDQVFVPKMNEIAARTQLVIKMEQAEESKDDEAQDDAQMLDAHHARNAAAASASSSSSPALVSSCCVPVHSPTLLRFSHFVSLTSRSTDSFTYHSLLFAAYSLDQSNSGGKYGAAAMPNGFARRLFDKHWAAQHMIDSFIDVTWAREYLAAFPNTMRVEEGMEAEQGARAGAAITAPMATDEDDEEEDDEFLLSASSATTLQSSQHLPPGFLLRRGARKLSQTKLLLFLRFFLASLHKTSAAKLPRANALRNICFTLLTKKDEELQRLALQALAKFQVPYVVPYLATLQALVNEGTWRDTMTSFVLAESTEDGGHEAGSGGASEGGGGGASMVCTVAKEHRKQFAAVLIRVLYPKLVQRKLTGKAGKGGSLSSRRAAILGFLGGLSSPELEHLVFLVMAGPFRRVLVRVVQAREQEQQEQEAAAMAAAAGKKNRKSLVAPAMASASSASPAATELSFEDILQSQVPSFDLPANSQALVRSLLVPELYKSVAASASSTSSSVSIRIPASKCLGFLHMLDVFLSKLRTLSMPYLKHFVVQLAFMICNTEIQLEKYRAHLAAQQEAEDKAAAVAAATAAEAADATMADENDAAEEKADSDDEPEAEDEEDEAAEDDAADEAADTPAAGAAEAKEDEAALGANSDDEAAAPATPASRSRRGSSASSSAKRAVPHALSKYLSELREIRQLAFTRMATILEQYPTLFAPEESALPFKPLPAPTKANRSLHAAESDSALVQKLEGPSLAPYLQFFLSLCWPSLRKLATEGTQHAGGLWGIMIHLSAHHALLTHFLQSEPKMLEIGWKDAERKRGLMLSLQSAKRLQLLPASSADPSSAAVAPSPFPLFSLLQASLGARSVHGSVVSAILSISEHLLAAKEDALSWEATKAEMEEIEAERAEKHAAQVARARERRKNSNSKMATKAEGGRTFGDESSDDEGAASEEDVALSHRLVQIETLYLTPLAHSARVRQYFLSHYSEQLHQLWQTNVDAYLAHMHRWLTSLSLIHAASNGRGIPAQANSTLAGHKSLTRKAAAAQAAKAKRGGRAHTSTFFPRRELEVLSSISSFASSARTAKLLVDLLVPFVHSPEKQYLLLNLHAHNTRKTSRASVSLRGSDALERHKPPPTLHNTLLHILLHLAPLLPLEHVEQLLEQLHKLLFSLRSNTHRALLTDLYVQLAGSPAITAAVAAGASSSAAVPASLLPLYAPVLKSLNALHARRIEEYDDSTRLEMYAALEAAFEREVVTRGLQLMDRAEQEEAALTGAAAGAKGKKGAAAAAASSKPVLLSPRTPAQLAQAAARRADLEARRAELDQSLVSTSTARSLVGREGAPVAAMFSPFFAAYFSRDPKDHQKALGMLRPLVFNLAHDLVDDDLGTRSSGCSMLRKLIAFLAIPTAHTPAEEAVRPENLASLSSDMRVAMTLRDPLLVRDPPSLLTGQLYPVLKRSLKHPADKIRRDVVAVLRDLITTFPLAYRHMLVLVEPADGWGSSKASQQQQAGADTGDFLDNIVHIQLHSRRRALTRLYQKVTTQDASDPNVFHADPSKALDPQTITQIIMPLLHHFIYDTSGAMNNVAGAIGMEGKAAGPSSGGHSGTMSTEKQRQKAGAETTLLEESIKLGGKLSAFLPWASYFHEVQVYLKLLRARPALERVLVRLVCACIREWHFDVEETAEEVQLRVEAGIRAKKDAAKEARKVAQEQRRRERAMMAPGAYEEEDDEQMDDDAAAEGSATEAAAKAEIAAAVAAAAVPPTPASLLARKIRSILTSHLLPQLHGLLTGLKVKQVRANKDSKVGKHMQTSYDNQNELTSKSGMAGGNREGNTLELVRVPVAMALVALLRKLPESIFHAEFPRLLTALCLQLQHREQQARDLTRSTLLDILALLGPFYFHFFVSELTRHLTSGYMLHVLGHMIYACLDVLVNKMHIAPGAIDHSIVPLMDVLMNDLLGEPAKQKEVAAIRAATKEARINHAADCFQLLASVIAFPGSIHYLVDPFRFKLAHDSSLRARDVALVADTLKKISVGLMHNPSVLAHIPDLLVYVHNYLFKNVTESFQALFPVSADTGKLSKQDKRATAGKQNRHRKLEIVQDKNPLEQLREENKARSEGKIASGGASGHASRKAMEFLQALQSSQAGHSSFERTTVAQKTSKDETFMLVRAPAPSGFGGSQSKDGAAISSAHHSNVVLVFGLNLLYFTLKHKKLAVTPAGSASSSDSGAIVSAQEAASNLQRLDPFLHLIRDYCLVMGSALGEESNAAQRSRLTKEGDKKITRSIQPTSSSAVIHAALKVSEHLLSIQGLPSLQLYLRDLTNYMFGLIHSKADPVILGACYSNLSVILRSGDWKSCGISAEKQKLLLKFIQVELMNPTASSATSVAFRLLQSILSRGVELPELYDFIIVVSQLMVTSEVDEIRKQSASAVYSFLYNYKLGAARMHTHLGFLLNQLSYPHATGRAAVLQLFHTIFSHFAPTVLEEQFEFLSLPLIVHLVNETNADNKKLLTSVLGVLFAKVGAATREKIVKMVYGWWKDEEPAAAKTEAAGASGKKNKMLAAPPAAAAAPAVRSPQSQLLQFASLHVVCILVEVMKSDFTGSLFLGKTVAGLAGIVREKLAIKEQAEQHMEQQEQDADAAADEEVDQSGVGSSWRVLYTTLLALEKLFKFLPAALLTSHLQQHEPGLFPDLLSCLLYPHTWVRTAACRIVGFVLAAIPMHVFNPVHARAQLASTLLGTPSRFFALVRSLTLQLQSPHLDDALADQIVKNLVWASVSAHHIGPGDIWENLEGDDNEAQADDEAAAAAEDEQEAEAEPAAEDEEQSDADILDDDQEDADEDAAMLDVPSADEDDEDENAAAAPAPASSKNRGQLAATSAASSIPSVLPTSNTLKRKQQKQLASLAAATGSGSGASSGAGAAAAAAVTVFAKSDNRILNWLFTRLSYMCRREEGTKKRESIFRYFATMSSSLPVSVFVCFLLQVVNPLYRLAEGQIRGEEADLQSFASSVLEMVQKQVGTTAFLKAYTHVRAQIQSVRQSRSIKKKSLSIINPAQAAQRKQSKNDLKRTNKKRKIQLLKSPKARAANAAASSSSSLSASSAAANSKKQRQG